MAKIPGFMDRKLTRKPPPLAFRLAQSSDIPALADIERYSQDGLNRAELREFMRPPTRVVVADLLRGWDHETAGLMVYNGSARSTYLIRLAVHPAFRRWGVGRGLLAWLENRLSVRRQVSFADVPETNVNSQLFFSRCGWIVPPRRAKGDPAVDGEGLTYRFVRTWRMMKVEGRTWLNI